MSDRPNICWKLCSTYRIRSTCTYTHTTHLLPGVKKNQHRCTCSLSNASVNMLVPKSRGPSTIRKCTILFIRVGREQIRILRFCSRPPHVSDLQRPNNTYPHDERYRTFGQSWTYFSIILLCNCTTVFAPLSPAKFLCTRSDLY